MGDIVIILISSDFIDIRINWPSLVINKMIRHILLFSLDSTKEDRVRNALLEALSHFPNQFPSMKMFQIGLNTSDRDREFEYAMTMEFVNKFSLDEYLHSEFHERFVNERFRPLITKRAIVTIEVE